MKTKFGHDGGRTRILQIIQNLNYGGMERLLADIVQYTDRDRFEHHVLCLGYVGRFGRELEGVAQVHLADPQPAYSMLWPGPLINQIRRIAPHVAHTHSGVWYKASLAARRAGVPRIVHTEHGSPQQESFVNRTVDRLAARRTDTVVAVSEALRSCLDEKGIIDCQRTRVVLNGVDVDLHRPHPDSGAVRREIGIAPTTPIIGSIGRLEPIKGYDIAIEAFARLRALYQGTPAPALLLAGAGSARPRLDEVIEAHGLREEVHMLGWRDDIEELHSAFTFFTMASRGEGTSVSLLEAMSAGLCPVVTDVGGNAAVLGPELRHRLVVTEDPLALAVAWRDALVNSERRNADGLTARGRIQQTFGIRAMTKQYERVYLGNTA